MQRPDRRGRGDGGDRGGRRQPARQGARSRRGTVSELTHAQHQSALRDELMSESLNREENVAGGSVQLVHPVGMHARPAVKLTKLAKRFSSEIALRVAGAADWIDAKSVASVMAMRAARDPIIEFEAPHPDPPSPPSPPGPLATPHSPPSSP